MPSPFPGMDPFLESPHYFPGLHNRMIVVMSEILQTRLPPPYYAEIGELLWIEASGHSFEPDVDVFQRGSKPDSPPAALGGTKVAPAERFAPVIIHVPPIERRHTYVEIFEQREKGDRLVSSIEILSPSNKTPGQKARKQYLRKQRDVLTKKVNLVEIDLLRRGRHTTAVPRKEALERTGPFDYHVCVHRFNLPDDFSVYPILLGNRLPEIAVPLLSKQEDVGLDLQAVFDRAYDTGPYSRRVRYPEEKITPALTPEQAKWVADVLREKGITGA